MSHFFEEEIKYYMGIDSPGYAILVTGKWGVGKTYRLKEIIGEENRIYVSLFGVQTIDQLHAEIIAENSPGYAKIRGFVDDAGRRASDVGGFFALYGALPGVFGALLRKNLKPGKVIIFDDLERGGINLKDLLGVINYYVEHVGFNVIVVAHDEALEEGFKATKEKIFGKTLRVGSDFDGAFDFFKKQRCCHSEVIFLEDKRKIIKQVFRLSGVESLRILRCVLDDLLRLRGLLKSYHFDNKDAIDDVVSIFVALDLEVRSGSLSRDDLMDRRGQVLTFSMAKSKEEKRKNKSPFVAVSEKYIGMDLSSDVISDKVFISMLVDGCFNEGNVSESLDASPYFLNHEKLPAWYKVINFESFEDDAVEKADFEMERQFEGREIENIGEMKHVFSLRMLKAYKGIVDKSVKEVKEENIEYIKCLIKDNRIPPAECGFPIRSRAYGTFGFWVEDEYKEEFDEVLRFFEGAQEEAFKKKIPEILNSLYEEARVDPLKFYGEVSMTNFGSGRYARVPVFKNGDPADFVSSWLEGGVGKLNIVSAALTNRYQDKDAMKIISSEKKWALGVLDELDRRIDLASGFARFRLERLRPASIEKVFSKFD